MPGSDNDELTTYTSDNIGQCFESEFVLYCVSEHEPKGINPLNYWKKFQLSYPNIVHQAEKILYMHHSIVCFMRMPVDCR